MAQFRFGLDFGRYITFLPLGEIRSCVTQKLNDEMKLIVATDQWETEAFDWPGLSEDSDHSLFRFAADIRSMVNKQFACLLRQFSFVPHFVDR